ncbi:MAG TPA: HAD-IB family hydrolase [Acidimicrobiia bacterium]|nr:HAD-IB family hydrolase [Acidimicrobiia bacterium]
MTAAAFFDLDRTLISGASAFPFAVEAWRAGLVSNREIARWTVAALMFLLTGDKGDDLSDNTRAEFLGKVAGVSVDQLDAIARDMLPNLVNDIRPESKKLLQMHHDAGRETWIVSASPQSIVDPLAQAFGMNGAIGTRGKIVDGHYTDELDGPFVYGEGKAAAIRGLAEERGYDLERSYAYSDSISDLPMLETVGHPVAVNPDGELERIAYERGWPIVIFARRTKRAIALASMGTLAGAGMVAAYFLGRHHGHRNRRFPWLG